MALSQVTVVIVTFHSASRITELSQTIKAFPHITIVDNASTDNIVATVAQHLPQAKLLINGKNLGFGAANNIAIRAAQTEFVLLLNPDAMITPEDAIKLVQCAQLYPTASVVAPQLLDRKKRLDVSYVWAPGSWPSKGPAAEGEVCVGFVSGACMLIRRDALEKIGGFDERFFLYYEDTDLCIRLAKECGPLLVSPSAQVLHLSRSSSSGRARYRAEFLRGYHHIQSKFLFEHKHKHVRLTKSKQLRYALLAALETVVRLLLLDFARASRSVGRVMGACASKP